MRLSVVVPLVLLAGCVSLPEGVGITISPASPATTDELVATLDGELGDPEKITWDLTWTRDGADAGVTGDTVAASDTSKGEVWVVTAVPTAGNKIGEPITAEVTVVNTTPVADGVSLAPSAPTTTQDIVATAVGSDVDEDSLSWTYAWTINGSDAGESGDTLAASLTSKGDEVVVTATPSDGEADGEAVTSDPITVVNTAPTAPTVELSPAEPIIGDDLVCAVDTEATDADGDSLTYTIAWMVDGAAYTGATSTTLIDGDTVPGSVTVVDQEWSCTATASDGEADSAASSPSDSVTVLGPPTLVPGNTTLVATYGDWSVRCLGWDGSTCVHIQQKVDCGGCSTYTECDVWHDTTTTNNGGNRTAINFCAIATGGDATAVSVTTASGTPVAPMSCGWSDSGHPICEGGRASMHVADVGIDETLGLLLQDSYCSSSRSLIAVQCNWAGSGK